MNIIVPKSEVKERSIESHYSVLFYKYLEKKGYKISICNSERCNMAIFDKDYEETPVLKNFVLFRSRHKKKEPAGPIADIKWEWNQDAPTLTVRVGKHFNTLKGVVNKVEKRLVKKRLKLVETVVIKEYLRKVPKEKL